MFFSADRAFRRSLMCFAACVAVMALLEGCSRFQSADNQLETQLRQAKLTKAKKLAKFAGTVTVDGKPVTEEDLQLVVVLTDANHLDENAGKAPQKSALVYGDGSFSFGTYDKGDGVPPGKYVVTFVEFHRVGFRRARVVRLQGPDALKNLYSDPDKNKENPKYVVDLTSPGKTDCDFDLALAGKDGPPQPGPNAVTKMGAGH